MKRLLLIALAAATPAYAQDSADVTPEQYTALQSYFACVYNQVAEIDDGVTEIQSLTPKVAPTCRYLLGAAATVFANGNKDERETWYNRWLALEESQVTRTVWAIRLERRAEGQTAAPVTASAATAPEPAPVRLAAATPPAAKPVAPKPKAVAAPSSDAKPMSEWRRAYIAKHGREPPVAAK